MSPKPSNTDRNLIIENFRSGLKDRSEARIPIYFYIDLYGTITCLPQIVKEFFIKEFTLDLEKGESCFDLIPTEQLEEFSNELTNVITTRLPGFFQFPLKNSSYKFFLSPLFTETNEVDRIQILISDGENFLSGRDDLEYISAESEQQFIFKLIKSLGKANDLKYGLSRLIKHISGFLDFDFAEAWEVGYDKDTLFKSATFSDGDSEWGDESIKSFKKGDGLPGITWKAEKVEVWDDMQDDDRFLRKSLIKRHNINIAVGVPIIHESEVVAILTFFSSSFKDTSKLRDILERISFQISSYVKRKKTENQLNNMFMFSPNLIAVVGLDGYLKKVNPSFIRIFGFNEEQLLNIPFIKFLHKDDKLPTNARLREVAGGLNPRSFQNRCLTSTGEYKWISWTPSELMEQEGVVHVFGMDITYIKKTNLELIKYRNIIESSKDGIGLYTLDTGEMFFNRAFSDILGYSEEELKEKETVKRIYANNTGAFRIFQKILKGNFWEGDLQLMDRKGKLLDYHFSGGPITAENDEIVALFGFHTDISERKKYESSLKEYAERINNVLESITDGFFSLNSEGVVTYWNKAAEEILQISRNNIVGHNLWDFFPVEKDPVFYQNYLKAKSSNEKISFEHFVEYLKIWVEVSVYPGKNGMSSYFKDITDRKVVEEEIRIAQERFDIVSKVTREAVYDWDISNNSLEWSDSYFEIYGYDRVPAIESLSQWKQQIHMDDRERVVEKMNNAIRSKDSEWICEYKLVQANRKLAVVLERGYIIRNEKEKAIRMIGSLQDITTLKQNERALEELNHKLKKHSQELTRSNAELEQFAYIASHDLQEPLRMVTSFLNLLEKKYEDQLDEKARQYINFASDGALRMRQIILDLLDYSRVGKLNYDLEPVDINVMIRNIIQLHENLIMEKKARIEFEGLPVIKAGVTPLQRVFSNLIINSIKYSRKDISPVIKIAIQDIGSHWEFLVEDNGIGMDEKFKEKIFVIFQRLHSRDEYSGTGIGLAISKKIVENHGGKIWVESKEGEGSIFHFTIQKHF